MKPEHLARLKTIRILLKDSMEEVSLMIQEGESSDFKEATHVDDKQDEIDNKLFEDGMTISDLKEDLEKVNIRATVTAIGEEKSGTKKADNTVWKMRNVTVTDPSGSILVPLWDEQLVFLESVKVLMEVDISAWRVSKYKDKLQLQLGTWGHMLPAGQKVIE